jgi:hypothetical protein
MHAAMLRYLVQRLLRQLINDDLGDVSWIACVDNDIQQIGMVHMIATAFDPSAFCRIASFFCRKVSNSFLDTRRHHQVRFANRVRRMCLKRRLMTIHLDCRLVKTTKPFPWYKFQLRNTESYDNQCYQRNPNIHYHRRCRRRRRRRHIIVIIS